MGRRGKLTNEELLKLNKKVTDEEAFEIFFRDCYLRNLRPATTAAYLLNLYPEARNSDPILQLKY
ncbi:hypothetical protein [Bacillus sp. V2I10]|uniref:hypothetical protein n=1 Tax=Bacillus sp. V2I10 TaxID=3042276 RepID=UPI0027D87058|nr:hypothetical protein [Bacillus sp. V2I10]